jgi:transcriptional regulator with XRE-family HTH domain
MDKHTGPTWYLREWIEYLDLKLEPLAERVGTSKGYLHQLMTGDRRWNADHLHALADAIGIPAVVLLAVDPLTDPGKAKIYAAVERIPANDRTRAAQVFEAFAPPLLLAE